MGPWLEPVRDTGGLPRDWLDSGAARDHAPVPRPRVRLERGRQAAQALMRVMGDALLIVMLRRSFRPVDELAIVPIVLCPCCASGDLRLAGTVRERDGRQPVRACDTCGAVLVGERRIDSVSRRAR